MQPTVLTTKINNEVQYISLQNVLTAKKQQVIDVSDQMILTGDICRVSIRPERIAPSLTFKNKPVTALFLQYGFPWMVGILLIPLLIRQLRPSSCHGKGSATNNMLPKSRYELEQRAKKSHAELAG